MMQRHFATLSSKYNISSAAKCKNTSSISLGSQRKHLSGNINHIIINKEIIMFQGQKFEKPLFNIYFLNQDISLNNMFRNMKLLILIDNIQMEGTVSQIFDVGFHFYFMKCRK